MRRPTPPDARRRRIARLALAAAVPLLLAGCQGAGGRLPPVFGAVFGIEGAETYPFTPGKVPEPVVEERDRVIGASASNPGQCIYADDATNRRFRAACPDGFEI